MKPFYFINKHLRNLFLPEYEIQYVEFLDTKKCGLDQQNWKSYKVIVIKKPYTSPARIWVSGQLNTWQNHVVTWTPVPGHRFENWWKWFKGIRDKADVDRPMTYLELFEEIGLQNL